MGTRESLPPPRVAEVLTGFPDVNNPGEASLCIGSLSVKNKNASQGGILAESKRGREKGEGSLSIPIVPFESREIRPRKTGE